MQNFMKYALLIVQTKGFSPQTQKFKIPKDLQNFHADFAGIVIGVQIII